MPARPGLAHVIDRAPLTVRFGPGGVGKILAAEADPALASVTRPSGDGVKVPVPERRAVSVPETVAKPNA